MENLDAEHLRSAWQKMTEHPLERGYLGPGIWIRIQHRFRTRMTEWLLATIMVGLGLLHLLRGDLFIQPAYAGFRTFFGSDEYFGAGMLFLGALRIAGLIVNGARKNVTPHIRMVGAGFGALIFFVMCYCHWLSGIVSEWTVIYPLFVGTEFVNISRAARDVGESRGRTH